MNSRISLQQFKVLLFVKGLFALLLAAPAVASAAIEIKNTSYQIPSGAYFVSPNGKASNSGKTPDSAWPAAKALASAPNGSTIVFRSGTYRNIKANINRKLTLQAYPHEKPWLKGSIEVHGWVKEGRIWRKDGWNYSFPDQKVKKGIDRKYPLAGHRDMVYINGVSLKQVASKAKVVRGTFYVDAANNRLYIRDNPAGKTVEATALTHAFDMLKSGSSTTVRGLGFAHYADRGIEVKAPRVTLENNTFVWNGVDGARFLELATDGIVRGNTFSYNGRQGFGGRGAHRILLEGNKISYNNVEHFAQQWKAAGVKFGSTNGIIWRNNVVEHNFATGMWIDESVTNATIVRNTVRNNASIGIQLELSHKVIVAANVVYNNPMGIMVADTSSAGVYNNTLSMNDTHIIVKDSPRKNTKTAAAAKGIAWISRDNVFKNNILSNTKGGPLFESVGCSNNQHSKHMITAADHNAYYRRVSSQPQSVITWSLGKGKCSVGYRSIAAFKSATGYEANALVVDNVATNPFFVNPANNDYRLKLNSPAIGRGSPLPADVAKAIGLRSGVPVDLGAIQSKLILSQ
jgi:parallel beta-helix repeat protein